MTKTKAPETILGRVSQAGDATPPATPEPPMKLTEAERDELDDILAAICLPGFTARERQIARATANLAFEHARKVSQPPAASGDVERLNQMASVVLDALVVWQGEDETHGDEALRRARSRNARAELSRRMHDILRWAGQRGRSGA